MPLTKLPYSNEVARARARAGTGIHRTDGHHRPLQKDQISSAKKTDGILIIPDRSYGNFASQHLASAYPQRCNCNGTSGSGSNGESHEDGGDRVHRFARENSSTYKIVIRIVRVLSVERLRNCLRNPGTFRIHPLNHLSGLARRLIPGCLLRHW